MSEINCSARIGAAIKDRRTKLGLSAEELAADVGLSPATLYRYENGSVKTIPTDKLNRIADRLNTSVLELQGLIGSPIVLSVPASKSIRDKVRLNGVVRISEEAELALLELCGKTGLSMRNVASALIVQAAQVCEIRNE